MLRMMKFAADGDDDGENVADKMSSSETSFHMSAHDPFIFCNAAFDEFSMTQIDTTRNFSHPSRSSPASELRIARSLSNVLATIRNFFAYADSSKLRYADPRVQGTFFVVRRNFFLQFHWTGSQLVPVALTWVFVLKFVSLDPSLRPMPGIQACQLWTNGVLWKSSLTHLNLLSRPWPL